MKNGRKTQKGQNNDQKCVPRRKSRNEEFVEKVYLSCVEGTNRRGRPLGRWEDRVKEYVSERGVRGNGLENWTWNGAQQLRVRAVEMSYLRGACGVSRWGGLSNECI